MSGFLMVCQVARSKLQRHAADVSGTERKKGAHHNEKNRAGSIGDQGQNEHTLELSVIR